MGTPTKLPIDVVEKLAACRADVDEMRQRRKQLSKEIDELVSQDEGIPIETFDDPSVVREVDHLRRTAERVRRESDHPVRVALPAGRR